MVFIIFVGGILEYNSGKTTIAKNITSFFEQELDLSVAPFKPLSGNNLYYNYAAIKESVKKHGTFVSLDVVELYSIISNKVPIEIANPVHKVNTQALAHQFFSEGSLKTFYSRYSGSVTLFQRFSICSSKNKIKTNYIINEPIYSNEKFWCDLSLIDPIIKNSGEFKLFKNDHEYYALNNHLYAESIKSAFNCLKQSSPVVIIESFNNSAHPAWCIRESNVIFLVGPGSLFIYEPQTYFRAIDNYHSINRNKPTTTEDILQIGNPMQSFQLPIDLKNQKEEVYKIVNQVYESFK
ncbi:MAG: hypothetical protein ACTSSG_03800 [Candidatus Heimdallarchaeaceae archaeon]